MNGIQKGTIGYSSYLKDFNSMVKAQEGKKNFSLNQNGLVGRTIQQYAANQSSVAMTRVALYQAFQGSHATEAFLAKVRDKLGIKSVSNTGVTFKNLTKAGNPLPMRVVKQLMDTFESGTMKVGSKAVRTRTAADEGWVSIINEKGLEQKMSVNDFQVYDHPVKQQEAKPLVEHFVARAPIGKEELMELDLESFLDVAEEEIPNAFGSVKLLDDDNVPTIKDSKAFMKMLQEQFSQIDEAFHHANDRDNKDVIPTKKELVTRFNRIKETAGWKTFDDNLRAYYNENQTECKKIASQLKKANANNLWSGISLNTVLGPLFSMVVDEIIEHFSPAD